RTVELGLRVAQLYEVQLGDEDSAIARYGRVLAADGTQAQALDALDRLYEATGNWNELAAVLARQSQLASSPDIVLEFKFRLGHLYQKHLGRVDLAIAQYQEILAAAPEHAKALGALEELFAGGVQPLVIAEILEQRAQVPFVRDLGLARAILRDLRDAVDHGDPRRGVAHLLEL
ncbi:MAG: hypothetical protein ACK5U8_22775, partial [Deltaproteobacteria bacterium]